MARPSIYRVRQKPLETALSLWKTVFRVTFAPPCITVSINEKVKCKAIPLQAWTGPEGSRRLRLPDFKKIGT